MKVSKRKSQTLSLTLDDYQRANLLWALKLICGRDSVKPFDFLDTGDWAREVLYMLEAWESKKPSTVNPNGERVEVIVDALEWTQRFRTDEDVDRAIGSIQSD